MKRYGSLPLPHQPGEKWMYNSGSDILGVLIARASGQTLGTFLREPIFEPLGTKDTGLVCPRPNSTGMPVVYDESLASRFSRPPVFESGAGGLVFTADDLLAFGQMMLSQGKHGSKRILSRPSVEVMTTDHLTPEQKAVSGFFPASGTPADGALACPS